MLETTQLAFLRSLAVMLSAPQKDTPFPENALALICTTFCFDGGLVYESGWQNGFHEADRYGICAAPLNAPPPITESDLHEHLQKAKKAFLVLSQSDDNAPFEQALLSFYHTTQLVLTVMVDDAQYPCAFVVFLGASGAFLQDETDRALLLTAVSLLMRHTESKILHKRLQRTKQALERVLDSTGIDIYVNDFYTHEILYANEGMAQPYGGKQNLVGKKCWQALFPGKNGPCDFCPEPKLMDEEGNVSGVYSWNYQRPFDGRWFRVFSTAFQWTDGRLAHLVSSADITENKQNEALIEKLANYDHLTGLPNRRMLVQECERRINNATANEKGYVLFFDIDNFKQINDTLGHDAGDDFLIQLGEFFSGIPLLKDSIYRNGGDEFVATLGGENISKESVVSLCNFIHNRFKQPWRLRAGDVHCGTSIGIACYPEDGVGAEILLRVADMSMYQVKKSGGAGLCFGCDLNQPPNL